MSVYIKGFPLPNNCGACPLRLAWCRERIYMVTRPERCPLVPVPEHGDLIDRDALMKILSKVIDINASIEQRNEATDQERRCLWWFEQQIGIAPTIIPADKEGDNADNADAHPVRHGWWIMRGGKWRCSECDSKALLRLSDATGGCREYEYYRANYCPNCGAKMDKENE